MLNGEVGFVGQAPKAIAGGILICEKLDGVLARFFTLREQVFDFQFQLIDAATKVVRANIAKRLTQDITGEEDVLDVTQLTIGFSVIQARLQSDASLYCNVLEYEH